MCQRRSARKLQKIALSLSNNSAKSRMNGKQSKISSPIGPSRFKSKILLLVLKIPIKTIPNIVLKGHKMKI